MDKQLKAYFRDIKKNLPCYNKTMRKMLNDLKVSINAFVEENNIDDLNAVIAHFGTSQDIAREFAIGIDNSYIKSYKFKKRVTAIVLSILAAILVIVASLSIYIYIENERNSPVYYNNKIIYEDK